MKLDIDLTETYIDWIKGKSLRYLAAKLQKEHGVKVTHTSLFGWLNDQFGEGATNRTAMSLQRSLLSDYIGTPHGDTVEAWIRQNLHLRSEVQHRSKHSIRQLTVNQTCRDDEILEYMTPQEDADFVWGET